MLKYLGAEGCIHLWFKPTLIHVWLFIWLSKKSLAWYKVAFFLSERSVKICEQRYLFSKWTVGTTFVKTLWTSSNERLKFVAVWRHINKTASRQNQVSLLRQFSSKYLNLRITYNSDSNRWHPIIGNIILPGLTRPDLTRFHDFYKELLITPNFLQGY
jgi:hypothetical protein